MNSPPEQNLSEGGEHARSRPISEWADVFSSAACVVTLVDRLIHHSEIVQLDGESYHSSVCEQLGGIAAKVTQRLEELANRAHMLAAFLPSVGLGGQIPQLALDIAPWTRPP